MQFLTTQEADVLATARGILKALAERARFKMNPTDIMVAENLGMAHTTCAHAEESLFDVLNIVGCHLDDPEADRVVHLRLPHPAELLAASEQAEDNVRAAIAASRLPIGTALKSRLGNTGEVVGWDAALDLPLVQWKASSGPEACEPYEYEVVTPPLRDELDAATGEGRR